MPTFVGIFAASGAELPGPTKALLATGEFLKQQWLYILTGLVIFVFPYKTVGKNRTRTLLYRLPLFKATYYR